MTATMLIKTLRSANVTLEVHGDKLCLDAPFGILTDDLRQAIRENKPELITLLSQSPDNSETQSLNNMDKASPKTCLACGGNDIVVDAAGFYCLDCQKRPNRSQALPVTDASHCPYCNSGHIGCDDGAVYCLDCCRYLVPRSSEDICIAVSCEAYPIVKTKMRLN